MNGCFWIPAGKSCILEATVPTELNISANLYNLAGICSYRLHTHHRISTLALPIPSRILPCFLPPPPPACNSYAKVRN